MAGSRVGALHWDQEQILVLADWVAQTVPGWQTPGAHKRTRVSHRGHLNSIRRVNVPSPPAVCVCAEEAAGKVDPLPLCSRGQ